MSAATTSMGAEQVLAQRADRIRRRPTALDEERVAWIAEFPIADERYAVRLDSLRGALPLRAVRPVPLSPPHVIGVLRFQGQLVTALSLASLLGVRGWRQDPSILCVVDVGDGAAVAFDCESIPIPRALSAAALDQARSRDDGEPVWNVTTGDLERIQLVDLARLLARRKDLQRGV
jgi:purine-binding chemotaxis protein CheW